MRPGADAKVIAELPIVEVVLAPESPPGEGGGLVALVAGGAERVLDGELHIGGLVVLGKRGRPGVEGGVWLYGQLIRREMRRAARDAGSDIGACHVDRLAGESVHEVDVDVVEAFERRFDAATRLGRRMDAAKRGQHRIVEALHAERDASHASRAKAAKAAGLYRA